MVVFVLYARNRRKERKKIIERTHKKTDLLLDSNYLNNNAANIPDAVITNGIFVENIGDKIKLYDKIK